MNIIFGPVNSRRFGKSLGIDLSPSKKQCNFDCLYCELAPAKTMESYEDVVSIEEIMEALTAVLAEHQDIDALTGYCQWRTNALSSSLRTDGCN